MSKHFTVFKGSCSLCTAGTGIVICCLGCASGICCLICICCYLLVIGMSELRCKFGVAYCTNLRRGTSCFCSGSMSCQFTVFKSSCSLCTAGAGIVICCLGCTSGICCLICVCCYLLIIIMCVCFFYFFISYITCYSSDCRPRVSMVTSCIVKACCVLGSCGCCTVSIGLSFFGTVCKYPCYGNAIRCLVISSGICNIACYLSYLRRPSLKGICILSISRLCRSFSVIRGSCTICYILICFKNCTILIFPCYGVHNGSPF